jgi:predicted metal-dependent hydrolase
LKLFIYNGEEIKYKVKRSRRKTIGIRICPEEGVILSIPMSCSEAAVQHVLNKKGQWILSKLKLINSKTQLLQDREYVTGERMKFLGDYYNLNIIEGDYKSCSAVFEKREFSIYINNEIEDSYRRFIIKEVLVKLYREIAKRFLQERSNYFANILNVKPAKITIKEQKSVWGSCSSKGNINYNWKIIMAPIAVVDYIVVHELCHLRQPNHSQDFWKLVESVLPDYKIRKNWLKDNGITLDIDKIS